MKVFGKLVLVEQIVITKLSNIMLPGGKKADSQTSVAFRVLQTGNEVDPDGVQPGDIPVFGKHTDFHGVKVISKETSPDRLTSTEILHVIVFESDILAADEPETQPLVIDEAIVNKK